VSSTSSVRRCRELSEAQAFDLAWLPGAFLPGQAIAEALARIHEALRPGGWLIFAMLRSGDDALVDALARLRTVLLGGCLWRAQEIEAQLQRAAFGETRVLPSPPGGSMAMIAARRD
jgi:hypothetical protein